jgi:PAS domain-containing protein
LSDTAPLKRLCEMEDHIALRGNAALLFQILEATSGGVWDWNIPSGNAVFSSRYAIMLGYEPEEFPKDYKSWSRLVHPHDLCRVKQAHADHIVKHKDFSVEFRIGLSRPGPHSENPTSRDLARSQKIM